MNNYRRKAVKEAITNLKDLYNSTIFKDDIGAMAEELEYLGSEVENIAYDEEGAFNNIPESLQESYRAIEIEENVSILDSVASDLMDFSEECKEMIEENVKNRFLSIIEELRSVL